MTIFLALSALVWLPYGLYCFARPDVLHQIAGVAATTPTAMTELRAMYGGLQAALGALAIVGLMRPELRRSMVLTFGILAGGLGLARLGGILMGGGLSGYTVGGLAFEYGFAIWAGVLLKR